MLERQSVMILGQRFHRLLAIQHRLLIVTFQEDQSLRQVFQLVNSGVPLQVATLAEQSLFLQAYTTVASTISISNRDRWRFKHTHKQT